MKSLKLLFMGTPEFATGILNYILNNSNHKIVGVVTVPDKPAGRGQKIRKSSVKLYAEDKNIPIYQPENLKDESFLNKIKLLDADVFFVVAFRFLPTVVWEIPKRGTINLHASLLPDYRGAAPINWAVINGETKTGLTTFLIDKKIDTGAILLQSEMDIAESETAGNLHDRMVGVGSQLSVKTLDEIAQNNLKAVPQKSISNKDAPKIFTKDCEISWEKSLKEIHNHVRGLSPYPGAYTFFMKNDKKTKVKIKKGFPVAYSERTFKGVPELIIEKKCAYICVKDGRYMIEELQIEGKKPMNIVDFTNGINLKDKWKLT